MDPIFSAHPHLLKCMLTSRVSIKLIDRSLLVSDHDPSTLPMVVIPTVSRLHLCVGNQRINCLQTPPSSIHLLIINSTSISRGEGHERKNTSTIVLSASEFIIKAPLKSYTGTKDVSGQPHSEQRLPFIEKGTALQVTASRTKTRTTDVFRTESSA